MATTTTTTKRLYFRILEREKKTAKRWKSLLLLFLLAWSGYCLPLAGTRNAVAVVGPLKSWSSPKPTENGVTQSFYFVLSFYYFYVFSFVSGWRELFGVGKHSIWSHMVFFIYVFFFFCHFHQLIVVVGRRSRCYSCCYCSSLWPSRTGPMVLCMSMDMV